MVLISESKTRTSSFRQRAAVTAITSAENCADVHFLHGPEPSNHAMTGETEPLRATGRALLAAPPAASMEAPTLMRDAGVLQLCFLADARGAAAPGRVTAGPL